MVTRMERYNNSLEDVKITKRSDKNKDLYEKVKVTEMNPEYIDINTTNVYEIGSINDVTKRRSSYQKLRSLDDVLEKERTIIPLEEKPLPKEERLYNIDDILKKAKETYKDEEKKRLLNTEYNILTKLDLDKVTSNDGFSKDHYKKMVDDLYSEKEIKQDDGKELFADLMEDENKEIKKEEIKPEEIKEEKIKEPDKELVKENIESEKEEDKEEVKETTGDFVTKIEVTKEMKANEDEDEDDEEEFIEKRSPLLTIIIILVVLLLLAAGYLLLKHFGII